MFIVNGGRCRCHCFHLWFSCFLFIYLEKCFLRVKDDQLCYSARISASVTDVTCTSSKNSCRFYLTVTETENGIMGTNPSEIFQKVGLLHQKHRGANRVAKRVNKSSYRTSSSTPGTPKLPAVHVQTRSITTGCCSQESARGTMSKREGQKQSCQGVQLSFSVSRWASFTNFRPRCCSLTEARRTDRRVKSRWRSGVTIKVKSQTAAREQLPVQTFEIQLQLYHWAEGWF